jgi:hypothetical protein
VTLRLAPCSHAAALASVRCWHYSKSLPCPPMCRYGVWENARFVGSVIFARGSNRHLGRPFGLRADEIGELARVSLGPHAAPTSRIVAVAVRLLRRQCPGLRLLVSFADVEQQHHGGIYQAMNWTYIGMTAPSRVFVDAAGRRWHPRMVSRSGAKRVYGELRRVVRVADCQVETVAGKHRYALPFDDEVRARVVAMALPYPKRGREADSGRPVPTGRRGASPTRPLQTDVTEAANVG